MPALYLRKRQVEKGFRNELLGRVTSPHLIKYIIMTIKQIIQEFNSQLNNKEIKGSESMNKVLGVLAVKAETIGGKEGYELAELCDRIRPFFKKSPNVTSEESLLMASDMAKLIHFTEKDEYAYLFSKEEEYCEPTEEEKQEAEKDLYSEECRNAYKEYLRLRRDYIKRFGDLPDMEDLL